MHLTHWSIRDEMMAFLSDMLREGFMHVLNLTKNRLSLERAYSYAHFYCINIDSSQEHQTFEFYNMHN